MRKLVHSILGTLGVAALIGATACSSTPPPAATAPPSTGSLDFAASPETTRDTGIVRWVGNDRGGIWLTGKAADGSAKLEISTVGAVAATSIHLNVVVHRADGTLAEGAFAMDAGHIVANTLPAGTSPVVARFKTDFDARPEVRDAATCQSKRDTYFWALLAAEGVCASSETGAGAVACAAALGYAATCYNDEVAACDNCPCGDGDICSDGVCQRPPCTSNDQCTAIYGPSYVCSGGGCVSSGICQSTGCQGQCGTITDNCYEQIDCGSCCTSWGECGENQDSCGNWVDHGGCPSPAECQDNYCTQPCDIAQCYAECDNQDRGCDEATCGCLPE